MAQWSMGIEGVICSHNQAGVRFGGSESSQLLLQIHWNNEALKSGLTGKWDKLVLVKSKSIKYGLYMVYYYVYLFYTYVFKYCIFS